jgi:HK97 gp10 family phage protein
MVRVRIEGLQDLTQTLLRDLPESVGRNSIRRTLRKRAEPVRDAWKANAPKDEGHYAESIVIGTRLTRRQAREAKRDGKRFAEIHIGTADPAGQQQEFGNVNHPAQPSGRPAWESKKAGVLLGIGEDFRADLERTAARRARKLAKG